MSGENPLVSIIVRTKDRPKLLKRAIQSIASQTYKPVEVVLVNDGGCDLAIEELKTVLGDISLNYIQLEKNTGRAHAGNLGIENAKGKFISFLDDDDEFYSEHISTLISFLRSKLYGQGSGVQMKEKYLLKFSKGLKKLAEDQTINAHDLELIRKCKILYQEAIQGKSRGIWRNSKQDHTAQ
ncbi:MAG: glycosyltransferase family 2 protein, partial [Nitrospirales bacterium]